MSRYENDYLDLLFHVYTEGTKKPNRTGVDTYCFPGLSLEARLDEGFPMLTTKKLHWKSIVHELLWFISGSTNISYLQENGVSIWDEWADENGDLGPVYGHQWRHYGDLRFDQLQDAIEMLKKSPSSRRILVDSWVPDNVNAMALPPCHFAYQFVVDGKERLHTVVSQRSADLFLGVPFNMASYALLTHMVGYLTGLEPYRVVLNFGDAHIYVNHQEAFSTQYARKNFALNLPKLAPFASKIIEPDEIQTIDDFAAGHCELEKYESHAAIKAPVAV